MKNVYFLLLIIMFFSACSSTKIADLNNSSVEYEGKSVKVCGKVENVTNLGVVKWYRLDDGTGSIHILPMIDLPKEGEEHCVTGKYFRVLQIGSVSLSGIKEE